MSNLPKLPNFFSISQYERKGAISIEEGIERIKLARYKGKTEQVLFGVIVSFKGNRLATFMFKGVNCAKCPKKGMYFAIEKCIHEKVSNYHVNLWGINKRGEHFLMTSDHIMPKSKGGEGSMENRQPMCSKCNSRKGDKIPGELKIKETSHAGAV